MIANVETTLHKRPNDTEIISYRSPIIVSGLYFDKSVYIFGLV